MPEENLTPAVPVEPAPAGVVVPPAEPPKKGRGILWPVLVLVIAAAGAGGYFLYTQFQKPVEQTSVEPPRLTTQEGKPDQGFSSQPVSTTPSASPTITITATDSVLDIEKDLSGTTIESQNTSEFDANLQSL